MGPTLSDPPIRQALRRQLEELYWADSQTLIIDEMGLRHGWTRIDIAVVNGLIHGFEIKSNEDTLRRLPRQAEAFNAVLDRVTLVAGRRHVQKINSIIPQWWGIQQAEIASSSSAVILIPLREPKDNPCPDPSETVKLLWREEALAALNALDAAAGLARKPRAQLYARLVEATTSEALRALVRNTLRSRGNWRSDEPRT